MLISSAKAKLLVEYPLFGTIASKLKLIKNDDIDSFESNGVTLEYNSDFFNNLTINEMIFVLANGAMHASMAYSERKNNRSSWLWQLSTDYAINDILVENGMDRPYQAHYSKRFKGLYAEEIYAELKEDILRDELEYESDIQDDIQQKHQSEGLIDYQDEQLFEEFVKATIDLESIKSEIPKGLDRFFNINNATKIDWRDELRIALDKFHKDDYSQMPPNKKFLHLGIYLPSITAQRFKFVIAVDSSGSIDEKLLGEFLSEINSLCNTIPSYQIDLLVCDDKICSHNIFYNGDILKVDVEGGGATDFRAVFEFIETNLKDTKLLLYFSDLDGIFPKKAPPYDVKWITKSEKEVVFGEVITI